jgi:3alpha(or 20beta)-hydroxysteroid dehydrogenase
LLKPDGAEKETDMDRLTGKVALVTGSACGQGAAEANLFAEEGAAVIVADVNEAAGEAVAAGIRARGGSALFCHHDVTNEDGWLAVVARAVQSFGALHVLVNNAGTTSRSTLAQIERAGWDHVMAVNLTGPMLGMKYCGPVMRDSGGGSIINVSSTAGMTAHYDPAYTASKWGLRGLTKTAAVDFAPWGVRVNSIHPGQISNTSFWDKALPGVRDSLTDSIPMERPGTPKECALLALFLASDESMFITGSEIAIDGGYSAGAAIWMRSRIRDQILKERQ